MIMKMIIVMVIMWVIIINDGDGADYLLIPFLFSQEIPGTFQSTLRDLRLLQNNFNRLQSSDFASIPYLSRFNDLIAAFKG